MHVANGIEYGHQTMKFTEDKDKSPPVPPDKRPVEPVKEPPKPGPEPDTPKKICS